MAKPLRHLVVALAVFVAGAACGTDSSTGRTVAATGRTATITYAPAAPATRSELSGAASALIRRLEGLDLADGSRVSVDDGLIVVEVPSSRADEARGVLGRPGELRFRPVLQAAIPPDSPEIQTTPTEGDLATEVVVLPMKDGAGAVVERFQLGPSVLTGEVVESAAARFDQSSETWYVQLVLTRAGSPAFDAMAEANYGKQLAIVLDGGVFSAPTINATSFDGRPTISGVFTEREARDLALILRSPTRLQLREQSFDVAEE